MSHGSHRSAIRVFGDQVRRARHDAERRHVVFVIMRPFYARVDDPTLLALALGKHGITVNAYAPGGVETRLRQSTFSFICGALTYASVLTHMFGRSRHLR